MGAMIERLRFEVERFELYTGLKPIRLVVAPDVLKAYRDELAPLSPPSWGMMRYEFNGYLVEADPKLPVGAVLVDSQRGPVYPLSPAALPPPTTTTMAGNSEASPRPWRVSEYHADEVLDAEGQQVCCAWLVNAVRSGANVALIVAAVNAYLSPPADGHGWCRPVSGPWKRIVPTCVLPAGHAPPCIPEVSIRPGAIISDSLGRRLCERAGCLFIAGHDGPCRDSEPCPRDPVCDQGAGHEGPCRYEFPAILRVPNTLRDWIRPEDLTLRPGRVWLPNPPDPPIEERPSAMERVGDFLAGAGGQCIDDGVPQTEARAILSADCARPLAHAVGCECGRL